MEITKLGKEILQILLLRDIVTSELQKKFGEDNPIGSEVSQLAQMALLDEVDGTVSITEVGLLAASIDSGTEIPDNLQGAINREIAKQNKIRIDKPGSAKEKYLRSIGKPTKEYIYTKSKLEPQGDYSEKEEIILVDKKEPQQNMIVICPVFGKANNLFCLMLCLANTESGCTLSEKSAERLK